MPKKRKAPKRRRRIGATAALNPANPMVLYGSIALGFLLGGKINTAIDNAVGTNVDTKIIAGGQVGLGALLAFKKKGGKKMLPTVAGGVMLGAGVKRALAAFGIGGIGGYSPGVHVNGYQAMPVVGTGERRRRARVNGYQDMPTVGSYAPGVHIGQRAGGASVMGNASGSGTAMSNGGSSCLG